MSSMTAIMKAEEVIKTLQISLPPVDVEEIAALHHIIVKHVEADENISGMLIKKENRFIIGVNKNHSINRRRFSIAHELGHFFLHCQNSTGFFVDETNFYFRDEKSTQATDLKEIQANAFAAALLMPREFLLKSLQGRKLDINDDLGVQRLARRFGVSVQALTLRLEKLNFIEGFSGDE